MSTKHITLPVNAERLKSDERYRDQFTELFGSQAVTRALDPDSESGVYDYTGEQIDRMSERDFIENRDKIFDAASRGRVQK